MIALAVFVVAVFLSIAFRSPAALVLTMVCGLTYLYPYLVVLLFVAAVLFALNH